MNSVCTCTRVEYESSSNDPLESKASVPVFTMCVLTYVLTYVPIYVVLLVTPAQLVTDWFSDILMLV